jgi:acetolactate synthase-1/2/3 large subunit
MRTAGELIVDSLVVNGIDRLFCVPGESYLGLLDALYGRSDIDTVVCRHEAGAGFMAIADARLTGRPGVACVSRGPGASNAAIAVHTAQQDEVPFILVIGQVPARNVRRDSFQEIDYRQMYGATPNGAPRSPIRPAWRKPCCGRSRPRRPARPDRW